MDAVREANGGKLPCGAFFVVEGEEEISSPRYAFAGPLGIPVVTAGIGYAGSRTHAPDENFRLVDFLNGARHIARILDGFAGIAGGAVSTG